MPHKIIVIVALWSENQKVPNLRIKIVIFNIWVLVLLLSVHLNNKEKIKAERFAHRMSQNQESSVSMHFKWEAKNGIATKIANKSKNNNKKCIIYTTSIHLYMWIFICCKVSLNWCMRFSSSLASIFNLFLSAFWLGCNSVSDSVYSYSTKSSHTFYSVYEILFTYMCMLRVLFCLLLTKRIRCLHYECMCLWF